MKTTSPILLAALFAAALASTVSAQISPPFPGGINLFSAPSPTNAANYSEWLGPGAPGHGLSNLYFDSNATVPGEIGSNMNGWTPGTPNLATVFGGNPWLAGGGSVKVIFLGETAGWANDFGNIVNTAPLVHIPLVTDIENSISGGGPFPPNITSGHETFVHYAAGTTLDFFLNSGGNPADNEGGMFFSFGTANRFSGADLSSHTKWNTRMVTTQYFDGVSMVNLPVQTLLVGFEDVRQGVSWGDTDSNDLVVAFQFLPSQLPPVPEPSTYGIIGAAALAGLIAVRRFKRSSGKA